MFILEHPERTQPNLPSAVLPMRCLIENKAAVHLLSLDAWLTKSQSSLLDAKSRSVKTSCAVVLLQVLSREEEVEEEWGVAEGDATMS